MDIFTLKKRKYFVEAAKGYKAVTNGLVIQAALNLPSQKNSFPDNACGVGFTATKKLGKAHIRNFVKRRLRVIARNLLRQHGLSGINYIFIGRHNTAELDFAYLQRKADAALHDINQQIREDNQSTDAQNSDDCRN